ncbi:lck-interacting transmembrane adapter 1 isoform X3 [Nycticebus coucang]|nr:lck-interacting transmembrane adapter 1 isoform X3 [Nycticebus coucang]
MGPGRAPSTSSLPQEPWPEVERLHRMGLLVLSAPPALWVLACCTLFLWLWALCTACGRKRGRRRCARLQGSVMPAEVALLRQTQLRSLSKSDSRLHELYVGPQGCRAQRPVSMDLHPCWLEVSRDFQRLQAAPSAFPHQELPQGPPTATPSAGPLATYSNLGLAASSVATEYACVQKLKITQRAPQELQQASAEVSPAAQVDILYSRVCKPKRKDLASTTDPPDPKSRGAIMALESDLAYEALPLKGLGMDHRPLENVYESIQEMRAQEWPEPPALAISISGHKQDTWAPCFHRPQPKAGLEATPCPEYSSPQFFPSERGPAPLPS